MKMPKISLRKVALSKILNKKPGISISIKKVDKMPSLPKIPKI